MNDKFWERKLSAFLHDTPARALYERSSSEERVAAHAVITEQAGVDGRFKKTADYQAAASDRIPFPDSDASGMLRAFNGVDNQFRHPLGGDGARYTFPLAFTSIGEAEECARVSQPVRLDKSNIESDARRRADFFAHWRLWPDWLAEKDARCALLPADPRIADHSIFNHFSVTAAFAGAEDDSPAFLRFHLGPVQSSIAAARSTRDLWSGSYLISWLITTGLKKLSEDVGPDAVIFPNLHGQPLFDFLWRDELWSKMKSTAKSDKSIWETFGWKSEDILTPNFPNTFLALVPLSQAEELARKVETAISDEWKKIADACWKKYVKNEHYENNRKRFDRQVDRHLAISWQVTPLPKTLDDAEEVVGKILVDSKILERFRTVRNTFEKDIKQDHRDSRCYTGIGKTKLNNIGLAWSLIVELNAWQLDAVRKTRTFSGWSVYCKGNPDIVDNHGFVKDALNGREDAIFDSKTKQTILTNEALKMFDYPDPVGATTFIKRVWHLAYIIPEFGLNESDFKMPNTRSIANGNRDADDADENVEEFDDEEGKYFAVIAFDGDDMGKWVSGEKAPDFGSQLADYTENGEKKGSKIYFEENENVGVAAILKTPRPVTPSYHLQFSQALSNFAIHIVPRIIKAHKGRLIYAGGDDVLAMLPAANAIACADDLQRAFSGGSPRKECGITKVKPGFLSVRKDQNNNTIPLLVPGPAAGASCGIAIAHFKKPLQDVVREAQAAEKRAKKYFNNKQGEEQQEKNAFAVSVFKRSGEISRWTASFKEDKKALSAYDCILKAIDTGVVSAKFPHRILEFIAPYRSSKDMKDAPDFDFTNIVMLDLETAIERQRGTNYNTYKGKELLDAVSGYLEKLTGGATDERQTNERQITKKHDQFAGLLTVAAFLARQPQE